MSIYIGILPRKIIIKLIEKTSETHKKQLCDLITSNMKRYIEQLIEDIRQATWKIKPPHEIWEKSEADPYDELELEDISFVEKYIYGEEKPISEITGIEYESFPHFDQLNLEEQALLAKELEKLLECFNFKLDFPEAYPDYLRYQFIKDFWNEEHVHLSFGENHIEFCEHDDAFCPFSGYCKICEEVEAEMKYDEEQHQKNTKNKDNNDDFVPF